MKNKKVNINRLVKVKLTEFGKKVYIDYCKEAYSQWNASIIEKELKKSTITTELWYLFNIFGNKMYMGASQLFENNLIEILEDK